MATLPRKSRLDLLTLLLIAVMVFGTLATVWAHAQHLLPTLPAFLLGVFWMNLSFTAWHEPAHANFSTSRGLNDVFGWLASAASVYPGYFARRREHLVHHKWEGIEGKDPVYPRIQTTFPGFPLTLLRLTLNPPKLDVPPGFLPLTPGQRAADWASHATVLAIVGCSFSWGFATSLFIGWIGPRLAVFWLHAYYVCFFPHSVREGGFETYRVRRSPLLRFFTVGQNLHGVHHRWPSVPWYAYGRFVDELESSGAAGRSTVRL